MLSKGYTKRAENSLCYLRGWAPKAIVADEFERLQDHSIRAKSCEACEREKITCTHPPPTLFQKFADFRQKRTLKPFAITIALFAIVQISGIFAMTTYLSNIFKVYQSPIQPQYATLIMSGLNILAVVTFMCTVRFTGKRLLYLVALAGVCISTLAISIYGFVVLPRGYNSFDEQQKMALSEGNAIVYIPTACIIIWSFCSYCGILMMPW